MGLSVGNHSAERVDCLLHLNSLADHVALKRSAFIRNHVVARCLEQDVVCAKLLELEVERSVFIGGAGHHVGAALWIAYIDFNSGDRSVGLSVGNHSTERVGLGQRDSQTADVAVGE